MKETNQPQPEPTLPPSQEDHGALYSWKEIAGYLGVSVRTAQLWEEQRGLPVRRTPGAKGRVFAYSQELAGWRNGSLPQPQVDEGPGPSASRRFSWRTWAVPVLLAAAVLPVWIPLRSRGIPSAWKLDGHLLTVTGRDGRTVWTHRFEQLPRLPGDGDRSFSTPQFCDVDADGELELLFPFAPVESDGLGQGALLCFSSTGAERWAFRQDRTVSNAAGASFPPPYHIRQFAVVPGSSDRPQRIVVTASHDTGHPAVAALLDVRGNVLRRYWHAGHFTRLLVTDLAPGGGPEIYLGAISNSFERASLIVLDPDSFDGAAAEEFPEFQFRAMPPPREQARVILNRLRIGSFVQPFNYVAYIRRQGDTLVVGLMEDAGGRLRSSLVLTFDERLALRDLSIGSATASDYRRYHAQGLIPSDDPRLEITALKQLLYLTPWPRGSAQTAAPPQHLSD